MAPSLPKSQSIFLQLRNEIIGGRFKPGERLPTFDRLEARFGVSRAVVQQAVWRLRGEGFVHSVNRQGIYVSEAPPHLNRYALVFAGLPGDSTWARFNTALVNEARRLEVATADCEIAVFVGAWEPKGGAAVTRRLREEAESHRLAGLVLTPDTFELAEQPPFSHSDMPRVFIFSHVLEPRRPVVNADGKQLIDRALGWLKSRGRRRAAVIRLAESMHDLDAEVVRESGLECRPQWVQIVGRSHPEVVRQLVPLLTDYPSDQRPDGLFIADDNLVEHASAGLVDSGLRVGEDIDVVAHCNWPWAVPSVLPIQRVGFHAGDLLARCIEVINAQRRGEAPVDNQAVPALFEEEASRVQPEITTPVVPTAAPSSSRRQARPVQESPT